MISSRTLQHLSILTGASSQLLFRRVYGDIAEVGRDETGSIHPTALIHNNAILGKGVSVGPFCTVGSAVKIGNACQLHAGSHVMGNTELGNNCSVLRLAGIGMVIRDEQSDLIVASRHHLHHWNSSQVELEAILFFRMIIERWMFELKGIIMERDNVYIINFHLQSISGAIVGADLPGQTIIGCNTVIGYHAVVGVKCQDLKYKVGDECFLVVGDNNDIREFTSIHRSSKSSDTTVIGDGNLIMGCCHIAHDCKVGNNNIFANNTLLAGHVVIEDCSHTAGAVVVHQFCHIGSYSFIGGGSVISQDVPKYMMVSGDRAEIRGLNLEGLRRHGFSCEEVQTIRKAYRKIFMSSDTAARSFEERLSEVEQNTELFGVSAVCSMVKSIRDSFTESRRGICKFRHL